MAAIAHAVGRMPVLPGSTDPITSPNRRGRISTRSSSGPRSPGWRRILPHLLRAGGGAGVVSRSENRRVASRRHPWSRPRPAPVRTGRGLDGARARRVGFRPARSGCSLSALHRSTGDRDPPLRKEGPVSFSGEFYELDGAELVPNPVSQGTLPIVIGGNGRRRTLPLAARFADEWNGVYLSADGFRERTRCSTICCARRDGSLARSAAP